MSFEKFINFTISATFLTDMLIKFFEPNDPETDNVFTIIFRILTALLPN